MITLDQLIKLRANITFQPKQVRDFRKLGIAQLADVGEFEGIVEDGGVVIGLAEIDIKDSQCACRSGGDDVPDGLARDLGPLAKGSEADGIRPLGKLEKSGTDFQMIPRHSFDDPELRLPVSRQAHLNRPGRMLRIAIDGRGGNSELAQTFQKQFSRIIIPNPADHKGIRSEGVGMAGKIGGSAAHARAGWQQVPEDFSDSDNDGFHGSLMGKNGRSRQGLL